MAGRKRRKVVYRYVRENPTQIAGVLFGLGALAIGGYAVYKYMNKDETTSAGENGGGGGQEPPVIIPKDEIYLGKPIDYEIVGDKITIKIPVINPTAVKKEFKVKILNKWGGVVDTEPDFGWENLEAGKTVVYEVTNTALGLNVWDINDLLGSFNVALYEISKGEKNPVFLPKQNIDIIFEKETGDTTGSGGKCDSKLVEVSVNPTVHDWWYPFEDELSVEVSITNKSQCLQEYKMTLRSEKGLHIDTENDSYWKDVKVGETWTDTVTTLGNFYNIKDVDEKYIIEVYAYPNDKVPIYQKEFKI